MTSLLAALVTLTATLTVAQTAALPKPVPYLPQSEALCGGAAAAMVMRYWGATDVRPESFAGLVDPALDGIVTTVLVADLRARGWQAFPLRGDAGDHAVLTGHLARGRPIIALIEDRPGRFHYVVITAKDDAQMHFHDPAVAPEQSMRLEEFTRRWRAANFWMLLLSPDSNTLTEPAAAAAASPIVSRVAALLASGRAEEARTIAADAVRLEPDNREAWDALGTSLFVLDRDIDALRAWNRAGKPVVDTVQVAGLRHTRYRPAAALLGAETGTVLTAGDLARARQRLTLLPSAAAARVGYVPLTNGRVDLDAAIVERGRLPGLADLILASAKAPFSRDVAIEVTNLVGGGERLTLGWRFREGFERLDAALEAPAPLPLGGAWKLSGSEVRETFQLGDAATTLRWTRAAIQISDWLTPHIGWTTAAGLEHWPEGEGGATDEKAYGALRLRLTAGRLIDAHVTAEGWMRGSGATRLTGLARLTTRAGSGRLTALGGAEGVHGRTPLFLFPGVGDGTLRQPLLRAHPLVHEGTVNTSRGQILGRRLYYGTLEWTRPMMRLGLASIDAALFADAARGWQLLDGGANWHVDTGAGLRVRTAGGPTFRLDVARGVRDGRWAVSAGVMQPFSHWIF